MFKKAFSVALLLLVLAVPAVASDDVMERETRIRERDPRTPIARVVKALKGAVRSFSDLLGGPRP